MAFSTKSYTGDGTTTDFGVTFDYLDRTHVFVRVNKVETTALGSEHAFSWVNDTTIRVETYPGGDAALSGAEIELVRRTPIATPAVVFGGGAALSSENLNKNSEYLTFALQEATDADEVFTKLYLGAFAANPTTDNDGEAIQVGAVFYNSVIGAVFYWTGSEWIIGESVAVSQAAAADSLAQAIIATAQAVIATTKSGEAVTSATLAQTWAESPTAPAGPGTMSSKTAAEIATLSALAAQEYADEAAVNGFVAASVTALLADTDLNYTFGTVGYVPVGSTINTKDGFAYEVAAAGAADNHVVTAGGVKLYVLSGADGFVSPRQFGIDVTGATNQLAAIRAMIAAGFDKMDFAGATIRVDLTNESIVIDRDVTLRCGAGFTLDISNSAAAVTAADTIGLLFQGAIGAAAALTADCVKGAATLTVADTTGYTDALVLVQSSAFHRPTQTLGAGTRGWLTHITSIAGGTTMGMALKARQSLLTADTATVKKITPIKVRIEGKLYVNGKNNAGHIGVMFQYVDKPYFDFISTVNCEHAGVAVKTCWQGQGNFAHIIGSDDEGTPATTAGYGVSLSEGTTGFVLHQGYGRNCRHATAGGGAVAGVYSCQIQNFIAEDCGVGTRAFDWHEECESCSWVNCLAYGGSVGSGGFIDRGYGTFSRDCEAWNSTGTAFEVESFATDSAGISGGRHYNFRANGSASYGVNFAGKATCRISDYWFYDGGLLDNQKHAVYGTYVNNSGFSGSVLGGTTDGSGTNGAAIRLYASVAGAIDNMQFINITHVGGIADTSRVLLDGASTFRPTRTRFTGGTAPGTEVFAIGSGTSGTIIEGMDFGENCLFEIWKGSAGNSSFINISAIMNAGGADAFEMKSGTSVSNILVTGNRITGVYGGLTDFDASVTVGVITANVTGGNGPIALGTGFVTTGNV